MSDIEEIRAGLAAIIVKTQIVLPSSLRSEIVEIAEDLLNNYAKEPKPVSVSLADYANRIKQYYEVWERPSPTEYHLKGMAKAVIESLKAQGVEVTYVE